MCNINNQEIMKDVKSKNGETLTLAEELKNKIQQLERHINLKLNLNGHANKKKK